MPNAPFSNSGGISGDSITVVECPDAMNYISVLGFRLSAAGTNTAQWDSEPLSGEWTFLQSNYKSASSGTSLAVTCENLVTKGDLLTAFTVSYGSGNACTLADTQSNTWTQVGGTVTYNGVLFNG